MNGTENNKCFTPDFKNMTKKQYKKWCKKQFGSIKEKLPKPSRSIFMSKSGWVAI